MRLQWIFQNRFYQVGNLQFYNVLGETVPVSADFSNGNKLDISALEKGWYQLFFTDGTENYSTSFIKQ
jgi:hypothetical protein